MNEWKLILNWKKNANGENDQDNVQRRSEQHIESFAANKQWGDLCRLYCPELAIYKVKLSAEFFNLKLIVEPSCLFAGDVLSLGGQEVLQAVWGKTNVPEDPGKNSIKRTWSNLMEHDDFRQHMKKYFYDDFREIEDHVDGAFGIEQTEHGACEGDEGGPIMIPWKRKDELRRDWVQVGIVSAIYKHPSWRRGECVGTYERFYKGRYEIIPTIGVHHGFNNIRILNGEKFNPMNWISNFVGKS